MKKYEVEKHIPSFLPEDKEWKLVWSDEFDGQELDQSKWNFREYFWGKKSPTFTDEVYMDGESNLHIPLIYKDGVFRSAHLQTGGLTYDIPKDSHKWIVSADKDGKGLLHTSTKRLISRKLFLWGHRTLR